MLRKSYVLGEHNSGVTLACWCDVADRPINQEIKTPTGKEARENVAVAAQ